MRTVPERANGSFTDPASKATGDHPLPEPSFLTRSVGEYVRPRWTVQDFGAESTDQRLGSAHSALAPRSIQTTFGAWMKQVTDRTMTKRRLGPS